MQIQPREGQPASFAIIGRLDTNTSPQLEEYVSKLSDADWDKVVINMGECEFVSSAGLRVIVAMQKRAVALDGDLSFVDVLPEVMEVFSMTGFNKILNLTAKQSR